MKPTKIWILTKWRQSLSLKIRERDSIHIEKILKRLNQILFILVGIWRQK